MDTNKTRESKSIPSQFSSPHKCWRDVLLTAPNVTVFVTCILVISYQKGAYKAMKSKMCFDLSIWIYSFNFLIWASLNKQEIHVTSWFKILQGSYHWWEDRYMVNFLLIISLYSVIALYVSVVATCFSSSVLYCELWKKS